MATALAATTALALDDRHVDLWRAEVCDRLLSADAPWSRGQRLALDLEVVQRQRLVSLAVGSSIGGVAIARDARRVAADRTPPMLGITLVTAGACELVMDGSTLELGVGDVCLLATHQPFRKRMGAGYREAFLYCPLALAEAALGRAAPALTMGRAGLGPLTGLLADALGSVRRHAGALADDEWLPLLGSVLQLVVAVFAPRPAALDPRGRARAAWRARAERYIDDHLADPTLAPPTIAAALRISVRYLHRLFEPTGRSVAATILARRLERSHRWLLDPARRHHAIADLAYACGFARAEHFSRAFRARFGTTAVALRAARRLIATPSP